jgi:hypothetical protein
MVLKVGEAVGRITRGFVLGFTSPETTNVPIPYPSVCRNMGFSDDSRKLIAQAVRDRQPAGSIISLIGKGATEGGVSHADTSELAYWCLQLATAAKKSAPKAIAKACSNLLGGELIY